MEDNKSYTHTVYLILIVFTRQVVTRTRLSVFVTRTVLVLLLHASPATIVGFAVYVGNFLYKIAKQ
jgi:hypothetical protein